MMEDEEAILAVNDVLSARFRTPEKADDRMLSTAEPRTSKRVEELLLPDANRNRMPLTQDKYLVRENDALVAWEREVRKFLRNLSPDHGHVVSAVMIYEWATGRDVRQMVEAGESTADFRYINKLLRYYFERSYRTYILGRKVANAYRVPPGYYITRHRPQTLTLWAEYQAGTLKP